MPNHFSTGTVFIRQNLTLCTSDSDVNIRKLLTYKDDPRIKRITTFIMVIDHNIAIQMNQKELTKTFMLISNCK